jgi:hypothetical protein
MSVTKLGVFTAALAATTLPLIAVSHDLAMALSLSNIFLFEISSSHGGEYDVQSCLLGYTAV